MGPLIPQLDATETQLLRRRLYRVGDVFLPFPIAGAQALGAVAVALLWWPFLRLFGYQLGLDTSAVFLVPPALAGWALRGDLVEGRSPVSYALARVRWVAGTRTVGGRS